MQSKVRLISVLIFPRQPLGQNHKGIGCLFDINQMKVYLQWNNNSRWVTLYIILLFNCFTDCSHARFKQIQFHAYTCNWFLPSFVFPCRQYSKERGWNSIVSLSSNKCLHASHVHWGSTCNPGLGVLDQLTRKSYTLNIK